jgi:hypothetical protein
VIAAGVHTHGFHQFLGGRTAADVRAPGDELATVEAFDRVERLCAGSTVRT